jgi:hypothetical protein
MSNDQARGNAGVRGNGFVSSIAGDYSGTRAADHARQYQDRRLVSVFFGKLRQTGSIVINDRSGGNAVPETPAAEAIERQ